MPRQQQTVPLEWIHAAVPGLQEAQAALRASGTAHHSARHFVRVAEFLGAAFWHNLPIKHERLGDCYMQLWHGTAIAGICRTRAYQDFAQRIKHVHQFGAITTQQRLQKELALIRHSVQAMGNHVHGHMAAMGFHMHSHMAAMQHHQQMHHQQQMQMMQALLHASSGPVYPTVAITQGQQMQGPADQLARLAEGMARLQVCPDPTAQQLQELVLDDDDGVGGWVCS